MIGCAIAVATASCSSSGPVSGTVFVLPIPSPRNVTLFESQFFRTSTMLDYRVGLGTCYGQREITIHATKARAPKQAFRVQESHVVCDGDGTRPKGTPKPPGEIAQASATWSDGMHTYVVFSSGPGARAQLEAFVGALRGVSRERWLSLARRAPHHTP